MVWTSQRIDFKIDEFMRLIVQKGYVVTWEKASDCPCMPKDSQGQPDFNCPLCKGKGRYYYDPKTIQGIMSNFSDELKYDETGKIMSGLSYFTTLPQYKLGFWDRLTNKHSKIRNSEIVVKGEHGAKDRLRFEPVKILNLRTISRVYDKNVDFMFDEKSSSIDWVPTGKEPVRGERYTVEYELHPRWICIDLVNVLRDTYVKSKKAGVAFQELPIRALVRLEVFV